MSVIFRRNSMILCFFCNSPVSPVPRDPRSFRCPHCDCWNRFDKNGEPISDEPAMHDENLNARSFARRASPRKDRLPTMYGKGVFCHTCQTNQMLIANLLSNYLPSPDDPEYAARSESYAEYQRSVEARYPPVCADCLPTVEKEIQKQDHMARTIALGGFLKESRGAGRRQSASQTQRDKEKLDRELVMWKIRGCLWLGCLAFTVVGYAIVVSGKKYFRLSNFFQLFMPCLVVCSIFWTVWDPTYATYKRAQFQGRSLRLRGRTEYQILQMIAWASRLLTSLLLFAPRYSPSFDHLHMWDDPFSPDSRIYCSTMLVLELLVLLRSFLVLRLERPPAIRLTEPSSGPGRIMPSRASSQVPSRSGTPIADSDLLASLTLSSKPVISPTTTNPVFGLPSFPVPSIPIPPSSPPRAQRQPARTVSVVMKDSEYDDDDEPDPNAMDWSPIKESPAGQEPDQQIPPNSTNDQAWLRPQRFFAPEEPTGLENLFASTIRLVDADDATNHDRTNDTKTRGSQQQRSLFPKMIWSGGLLFLLVPLVPIVGVAYKLWDRRRAQSIYGYP